MKKSIIRICACAGALICVGSADAREFRLVKNVPYRSPEALAAEGDYARAKCVLDVWTPVGVTNFATVVNFHGGGLVHGNRHFASWQDSSEDPVAQIAASYRLLTNATPEQCVGDAAAAVAWTLDHIAEYGGDPKKVFVTGISGGGYLTAMVGMAPKFLAAHNHKITDLAGIAPLTGQVTTHFNVRAVSFKDTDPRTSPKIDEWAPLYWTKGKAYPPSLFLTGGRHDNEIPCRVEENELIAVSLLRGGNRNVRFVETEGSHGGGVGPSKYCLRDFVMSTVDAGGVARFAPGERVAFLGDSITHGGRYTGYLQLYQSLHEPGSGARILNVGISGDTAGGGLKRLSWDLLVQKPDRVFVMFGMNDVGRSQYVTATPDAKAAAARASALAGYDRNERQLVAKLQAAGKKVVLITPTPYDQYTSGKAANCVACNEPGLSGIADAVRRLAAERHLGLVDFHAPLTAIQKAHADTVFCADRVHPGADGHILMAALVLKAMHVDPVVAKVSLNATNGCVYARANRERKPETQNATVGEVRVRANGVAFTYAPKRLPFPKLPEYVKAGKFLPLSELFNRETFVIEGLPAGSYDLAFDGTKVGSFTAEQFAAGVEIALLDTPNQLRAQAAGKVASELIAAQQKLRTLAQMDAIVRNGKADPTDFASADTFLDKWHADMVARKSSTAEYYGRTIAKYRATRTQRAEAAACAEDLFARLDAVRPAVSRVTVTRAAK